MCGSQDDGAMFFLVVPSDRTRTNGQKLEDRKFEMNMGKNFPYCESDVALEQSTLRDCEVSFSGDIREPPWILFCVTYYREAALARRLDWMISKDPFQPL